MWAGLWPSGEPVSHTERRSDQAKGGSAHGARATISMLTAGLELCGPSVKWSPLAPLTSAVLSLKPLTFTYTEGDYVRGKLYTCLFILFHSPKIDANQLACFQHSNCSELYLKKKKNFRNNKVTLSNNKVGFFLSTHSYVSLQV